jgi:site-specific DNA-methyltransferase (adenine-specific)
MEAEMTTTVSKRSRKSEITAATIEKAQHQVERAIAEAFDPDSVIGAYDIATGLRLLARQADANKAVQNKCGATHAKSVRKIGELTEAMRNSGALVRHGGKRSKIDQHDLDHSSSRPSTLKDLGISKDLAAAGVKLLAVDPSEIDAMAEEATKDGKDFSCKKAVAEIRDKQQSARRTAEKAEAIKRRKSVDGLYLGDFRKVGDKVPDASVDLIFTDPPYDRKAIELYDGLGQFAARVLRPGGSLIAYVGHIQLPDVLADLSKHLRYWWTCGCFHSEAKARMTEYGIIAGWKPIVWFVKETRGDKQTFVTDVVTGAREKSHHDWQQAVCEARYFIELLTQADDFVVDPFCGGGTTPVACIESGRKWASFEIDEANFSNASSRIKEVMDDQAIQ